MSSAVITPQQVQKSAFLARLSPNLSAEELQLALEQLSAVLEHVQELQQLDTSSLSTTDGWRTISIEDLREDEPAQDLDKYTQVRASILNLAPHRQGDYFVVPNIKNQIFHES